MSTSTERMRRLRERRAAALRPGEEPREPVMLRAVETSIDALGLPESDAAVAQLARRLAEAIDQAADPRWAARWLAPELLHVLEQLGATPLSRRQAKPDPRRTGQLDGLRAQRRGI